MRKLEASASLICQVRYGHSKSYELSRERIRECIRIWFRNTKRNAR